MRFGIPLIIPLAGGGRLKVAKRPGEKWRRRKSNAAQISDLIALRKTIALCATCERRLPQKWGERYGYRRVHAFHTDANCDFQGPACEGFAACNLYHHMEEGYFRQYAQVSRIEDAARQQRFELRDKRRLKALS